MRHREPHLEGDVKRNFFVGLGVFVAFLGYVLFDCDAHMREVWNHARQFDSKRSVKLNGNKHLWMLAMDSIPIPKKELLGMQKETKRFFCVDLSQKDPEILNIDPSDTSQEKLAELKSRVSLECFRYGDSKKEDQFTIPANFSGIVSMVEKKHFFRFEIFGWHHWHFIWFFVKGKLIWKEFDYRDDFAPIH
jgi:hypothetical protein